MDLQDKVIVITGAASGIGREMARRFKIEGARQLIIADLNEEGLHAVAKETGAHPVVTNVALEKDVIKLITTAEEKYKQIDLLCSNAGIGVGGGPEAANEEWQRIWEINVMAHVYAARAALPAMVKRGFGISSKYRIGGGPAHTNWICSICRDQACGGQFCRMAGYNLRRPRHQSILFMSSSCSHSHDCR